MGFALLCSSNRRDTDLGHMLRLRRWRRCVTTVWPAACLFDNYGFPHWLLSTKISMMCWLRIQVLWDTCLLAVNSCSLWENLSSLLVFHFEMWLDTAHSPCFGRSWPTGFSSRVSFKVLLDVLLLWLQFVSIVQGLSEKIFMPEAFAQRRCFNPRSPTPNSEGFRRRDDFNADLTYCFFGMRFYYLLLYWLLIFCCYSSLLTIVSSSCTFNYLCSTCSPLFDGGMLLQLSKFSSHVSFTSMGGCYDCRSSSSMMLFEICQIFVFTTQVLMPALTLLDSTPSKAQLCTKNLHLSWVPIVACFLNVFYHKATVLIELHASQASAFDPLRRTINNTEHKHRRQFTYRPSSRTGQTLLVLRLIMFYMMVHDDSILLWLLVCFSSICTCISQTALFSVWRLQTLLLKNTFHS